jgi:hypothetical protein
MVENKNDDAYHPKGNLDWLGTLENPHQNGRWEK